MSVLPGTMWQMICKWRGRSGALNPLGGTISMAAVSAEIDACVTEAEDQWKKLRELADDKLVSVYFRVSLLRILGTPDAKESE